MPRGSALLLLAAFILWRRSISKPGGSGRPAVTWSDDDMRAFAKTATAAKVNARDALLVYTLESGLNPAAKSGAAYGIPQMTPTVLRSAGWTGSGNDFASLTVSQQIPYIGKLLQQQVQMFGRSPTTPLDLFVLNLAPAKAGNKSDRIYDSELANERANYQSNKGLDKGDKGYISRADLQAALNSTSSSATYKAALEQLGRVTK